ncbi:MAG: asparagine synthetase B [Acidobacteria bacterium]|nr:MAG: asparagine synthetase B [Acidobacteriota bacterium]
MSGIVGIYHRSGAPMEQALLQSLVAFLSYRGPDSREFWMDGSIGLGHAMLRTTNESLDERQPGNLDGRFWITADARLDGRAEFIAELERSGRVVRPNAHDSELILHAYATWGTPCVEHLRGDFSFAIWDAQNKQLFCARDHLGIKPFYYLQQGDLFLLSNTLNCIRVHPEVSGELNEAAIGDFLLFGLNCDNATTSFRDIQRLPPAHSLSISPEGPKLRRYWTPPTDGRIRYRKPEEYIENFHSLLEAAVTDRLRTDRAGILLSRGLDSSSLAAVAKDVSARGAQTIDIRCYAPIFESLIPDREGEYAREVAEFLRLPVKFMALDQVQLFAGWDNPEFSLPEPVEDPLFRGFLDSCRNVSADCRVLLSGKGVDNLLDFQMWPYAGDLRRNGEWRRLSSDMANYFWIRPFPWRDIRTRVKKIIGKDPEMPIFPLWFNREFLHRAKLQARWKELCEHPVVPSTHPIVVISAGDPVSVPGPADCKLSSCTSAVSLVLRKNASAGGHGPAHPRTRSHASEYAVRGQSGLGSTAESRGRSAKPDAVERGFRSLHRTLGGGGAAW